MLLKAGLYVARPVKQTHLGILAGALEVGGALPALRKLEVSFDYTPHVLAKLAEALLGGALPFLEHFSVYQKALTDDDLKLLVDVVERHAQIPGCHGLTFFQVNYNWLGNGSPEEIRLLRALLPSLAILAGGIHWHAALDPCFRNICPPHLEVLEAVVDNETFSSVEVLEAAPAIKKIGMSPIYEFGAAPFFQAVIAALHRGVGLRFLRDIDVNNCVIGDTHFTDFLDTLKSSGCAERMLRLSFPNCGIAVEGARALANLLRRDGIPALKKLDLNENEMGDEGVAALASGLGEAPRTMLTYLNLDYMEMSDVGMIALATIIEQGRMEQIKCLDLGEIPDITDKGVVALARAIDARGLPEVQLISIEPLMKTIRLWDLVHLLSHLSGAAHA